MSIRDVFAACALIGNAGMVGEDRPPRSATEDERQQFWKEQRRQDSAWCWRMADAMLATRKGATP
jgi:hypothetical protein